MVDPSLKNLYQEFILRHNRTPHNFLKIENPAIMVEAYNPLCGDQYKLFLELEKDHVKSLHFHGYGCSISKAATSVLTEKVVGLSLKQAIRLCECYLDAMREDTAVENLDPDFAPFALARNFPGREQCATLSWESLLAFFQR